MLILCIFKTAEGGIFFFFSAHPILHASSLFMPGLITSICPGHSLPVIWIFWSKGCCLSQSDPCEEFLHRVASSYLYIPDSKWILWQAVAVDVIYFWNFYHLKSYRWMFMIFINFNFLPCCYFAVFEGIHIPHVHESTLIDALSLSCSHTCIPGACVHVSFLLCRVYKNLTCLLSATEAPCLFPHPPNGRLTPSPRGGKMSRRRGWRDDGG